MDIIKQIQTTLVNQINNNHTRRSDQMAVRRAHANFALRHPGWAAAYFDEPFLVRHAAVLLSRTHQESRGSMAFTLAMEWSRQFKWTDQFKRRRMVTEATAIADDFLYALEDEFRGRSVALAPAMRGV